MHFLCKFDFFKTISIISLQSSASVLVAALPGDGGVPIYGEVRVMEQMGWCGQHEDEGRKMTIYVSICKTKWHTSWPIYY